MNKLLEEIKQKQTEIEQIKKENLHSKEQECYELIKKRNSFSKYEPHSILNILAKLMTVYEGVEYKYFNSFLSSYEYDIRCNEDTIYNSYKLEIKTSKNLYKMVEDKYIKMVEDKYILLLPDTINKNQPYISEFINYLFNKRVEEELYEIDNNKLEEILNEFLENTKDKQEERLKENTKKLIEYQEKEKRRNFENSCMISRQAIFKCISNIINDHEDNMSVDTKYEKIGDMIRMEAIGKLIVNYNDDKAVFETIIDTDTCDDDDMYYVFSVSYDKPTDINFFKLKRKFEYIFKNGKYINKFMEKVENSYTNNKKVLFSNDVNSLYKEFLDENNLNELIDLHMHSTYSDGELTPKELLEECIKRNIKHISITDHDTLNGNKEVMKIIKNYDIKYTTGIELSAKVDHGRMHILGYNIDIYNKELNNKMDTLRNNSLYSVISLLHQIKVDYDLIFKTEDILNMLNANHNLGRPDIAKLLVNYNYVRCVQEAFDKYLIPAYEKTRKTSKGLPPKECINLILNANGIPVLAHPKTLELNNNDLEEKIKELISYGLQGIEVYNSIHSKEEIELYTSLANKYNLLISGGTDYHGIHVKPDIELGTGINNNMKVKKLTINNRL